MVIISEGQYKAGTRFQCRNPLAGLSNGGASRSRRDSSELEADQLERDNLLAILAAVAAIPASLRRHLSSHRCEGEQAAVAAIPASLRRTAGQTVYFWNNTAAVAAIPASLRRPCG